MTLPLPEESSRIMLSDRLISASVFRDLPSHRCIGGGQRYRKIAQSLQNRSVTPVHRTNKLVYLEFCIQEITTIVG